MACSPARLTLRTVVADLFAVAILTVLAMVSGGGCGQTPDAGPAVGAPSTEDSGPESGALHAPLLLGPCAAG